MSFLKGWVGGDSQPSDPAAGGGGGGGWLGSLKDKTASMAAVYKRDLAEFVTVVKHDTTEAVEKVTHTEDPNQPSFVQRIGRLGEGVIKSTTGFLHQLADDQGPPPSFSHGDAQAYDRTRARLDALQEDEATFRANPEEEAFFTFTEGWTAEEHTEEISKMLEMHERLRDVHTKLVPAEVSYRDFWARYVYAVSKLREEEERRAAVLQRVAQESADDELTWDADDVTDVTPAPAAAPSQAAAVEPTAAAPAASRPAAPAAEGEASAEGAGDAEANEVKLKSLALDAELQPPEWIMVDEEEEKAKDKALATAAAATAAAVVGPASQVKADDDWGDWE